MRLFFLLIFICYPLRAADWPQTVFVPRDANLVNVRDYGARGDGITDDTTALQKAVRDNLNKHRTLFFPAGTYLISDSIPWAGADGIFWPWLTWQGEGAARSIIRLKDSAPGFSDKKAPRAMTKTGCYKGDGRGENAAHSCYFFDLTFDAGNNNPGAVAIDFNAHNNGAIVRVNILSQDGKGFAGLLLNRDPGPCLIKNLSVRGFDYGIKLQSLLFSVTFEKIFLREQNIVGLENGGNVAAIRHLFSNNKVPAVTQQGWAAMTVLIDSQLKGGAPEGVAVESRNAPTALLRNVSTQGYAAAFRNQDKDGAPMGTRVPSGKVAEYVMGNKFSLFQAPRKTLNLPVLETPEYLDDKQENWANIAAFGNVTNDASAAVQKAVDSGKPVIYFPLGSYKFSTPVRVRGNVRRIVGFGSRFNEANGKTLFRFENRQPVILENFRFFSGGKLENAAAAPVILKYIVGPEKYGLVSTSPKATWFFEDVCVSHVRLGKGQKIFARQWNNEPEPPGIGFENDGGTIWVLGLKSEWGNTIGLTKNRGQTEILGGLVLPAQGFKDPKTPTYICENARFSGSWNEMTFGTANYVAALQGTRGGRTTSLLHDDIFKGATQCAWSLVLMGE